MLRGDIVELHIITVIKKQPEKRLFEKKPYFLEIQGSLRFSEIRLPQRY
jgi:hypothetical protein